MKQDPGTKPPDSVHSDDTRSVAEALKDHLMPLARGRTIRRAVAGERFCGVLLDDGGVGVVNIASGICGQPPRDFATRLPEPGTSASEALSALRSPTHGPIGLATANALANRAWHAGRRWDETVIGGDALDVLKLEPIDHVAMVGAFVPLIEPLQQRVGRLLIFERGLRLTPGFLPADQARKMLPECSVALITATTLANNTIDGLLAAAVSCREVVLLGPSTPLTPEVFTSPRRRATLLSGMVATDSESLLQTVTQGGGTRDFKLCAAKVNVRVAHAR